MTVFAKYRAKAYPFNFAASLRVRNIAGGVPADPKVAEGWLRKKMVVDDDDLIRKAVIEVMAERGVSAEEAVEEVNRTKNLNGFKRLRCDDCPPDGDLCVNGRHLLYIEGRQLKAAIKEAANVRWPYPQTVWGPGGARKGGTKGEGRGKASTSFFAEHVFVQEDVVGLGVYEATDVTQRFVHTWRGNAISYDEYVAIADISFTVATDHDFTEEQWALLWLTGEQNGLGACRSQGFGRYEVTRWERQS